MQCESKKILLLPAWPAGWDVEFKLHAPLQTTVEGEFRDGKLLRLNVLPEARRGGVEILMPELTTQQTKDDIRRWHGRLARGPLL